MTRGLLRRVNLELCLYEKMKNYLVIFHTKRKKGPPSKNIQLTDR